MRLLLHRRLVLAAVVVVLGQLVHLRVAVTNRRLNVVAVAAESLVQVLASDYFDLKMKNFGIS